MRNPSSRVSSPPGPRGARAEDGFRWLSVGGPLALAILLTASLVAFIVHQARRPTADQSLQTSSASLRPQPREKINPSLPPEAAVPISERTPPIPRHEGKYSRWNLKSLPAGWDEGIAQALHSYFDTLTYDRSKPVDMNRIEEARQGLEDYLAGLGPESLKTLATILNAEGDFVFRRLLLKTVGRLGAESDDATFILRDFFMARYANPENKSEMIHTVEAMGMLQSPTSFEMLNDLVARGNQDSGLHRYRDRFIEALGEHPDRELAVDTFVDTVHNDQMIEARNKSAQALGKIASAATLPELYNAVEREQTWLVKQTLLGSIGKVGDPSSIPFLETQVRGAKEGAVRLSAGMALKRIGTPAAEEVLRAAAQNENDPEVRKRLDDWSNGRNVPPARNQKRPAGR